MQPPNCQQPHIDRVWFRRQYIPYLLLEIIAHICTMQDLPTFSPRVLHFELRVFAQVDADLSVVRIHAPQMHLEAC
jgi:hypothetical protein